MSQRAYRALRTIVGLCLVVAIVVVFYELLRWWWPAAVVFGILCGAFGVQRRLE